MKKYGEETVFPVTVTEDKLKIVIKTSDLIFLFKNSPNNYDESYIKKGMKKDFIDYVSKSLIDFSDADTGECLVMSMFEKVFQEIFEGAEDFVKSLQDEEC